MHRAHCLYKDGLHRVCGPSLHSQTCLCGVRRGPADDAIPMQTPRKLRMRGSIKSTLDSLNLQVTFYSKHLHNIVLFCNNNKGEKTYAGMSKIHGSCDVMLQTNAEYSHGLAPSAKTPVYLQTLLLLLCWLSLHLPTGAYKARTSHARSPANTIPTGRPQCKLFVYSCSLCSVSLCPSHRQTDAHTNTNLPGCTGTNKYWSVLYTSVGTQVFNHEKHDSVKIILCWKNILSLLQSVFLQ